MPLKLPLSGTTVSSLPIPSRPFICPSCRYKQARLISNGRGNRNRKACGTARQSRTASTTASVTAVNVKRNIPPRFLELHESLKALETEAAVHVNSSQLSLALRGLESENAITRIAGEFCSDGRYGWVEPLIIEQCWVSMGTMDLEGWRKPCWRILWRRSNSGRSSSQQTIMMKELYFCGKVPVRWAGILITTPLTMAIAMENKPTWTTDIRS